MADHRKSSWDMYPEDEKNLNVVKRELAVNARGVARERDRPRCAAIRYSLKNTAESIVARRAMRNSARDKKGPA